MPAVPVGWLNFKRLMSDRIFYLSVWNTFRIWILNFIPQLTTALIIAAFFTLTRVRGMTFFRAVFYLPNLITAASVGLLFNLLFNGNRSVANYILLFFEVKGAPFSFFNSRIFTSGLVSYIQWWMWFGYTAIIVVAGITTIEKTIYEAAIIDGASKFKTFTAITIPLINPTLVYLGITSIIGGMQLFDVPATLTEHSSGDPQKVVLTTSMYMYNQGFRNHNLSYASTLSMGLFLIIIILSILAFYAMRQRGEVNVE